MPSASWWEGPGSSASGGPLRESGGYRERLRAASRAKVRDLEEATGEDEAALEALYRSDLWYEINHALSAFGYWRAWALLGVAQARPAAERMQLLHRAEAGFKATSVRILYPGLVQGSWLGLGYVELARETSTPPASASNAWCRRWPTGRTTKCAKSPRPN